MRGGQHDIAVLALRTVLRHWATAGEVPHRLGDEGFPESLLGSFSLAVYVWQALFTLALYNCKEALSFFEKSFVAEFLEGSKFRG